MGKILYLSVIIMKKLEQPRTKEEIQQMHKEWREKNKERLSEYWKSYYSNPDKRARKQERVQENKKNNIQWLLEFMGTNKLHCDRCRYDKSFVALQFHHKDPSQKEHNKDSFTLWAKTLSPQKFQEKILNTSFSILCANCHAEFHAGLWE